MRTSQACLRFSCVYIPHGCTNSQPIQLNEHAGTIKVTVNDLQREKGRVHKPRKNRTHTSYTALPDSSLMLSISTTVPLVPVGLTSVVDVEALGLCWSRSRLKVSFKVSHRESIQILPRSPSPVPPASDPGSGVLPRRRLMRSTTPPLKAWASLKRLKSALASNAVRTHQKIRKIIITSRVPTGTLVHNSSLYRSASRPKAVKNDSVLSINNVRHTDLLTVTNLI